MLGDLISPLTKGLLLVAFLATSVAFSTTYLYLGTRDELSALQSTYTQLKQQYVELSESKHKVVEGRKQDDTLIVDKTKELSALEDDKDALLKRLEALSKSKKCSPKTTNSEEPKNEIINPSASWDADIQQLLNEAYDHNKRETNPNP